MKCPRCSIDLKSSDLGEYGFVIIGICPKCEGSWFDKGELDRLDESIWINVEEEIEFHTEESHQVLSCPRCEANLES